MEELTDIDYKWAVQQKWDKTTGDWNDTLSVTYIIPGANGKPSEIFTHNYDPIVGDMREVITYKDDKKMNLVAYMKDSLSGEFQKEPYCIQTFWYTEDILAKYEIVIDLSKTSFSEKIKYHIEKGYRAGNQRIAADSTLIKYSGSEEEFWGRSKSNNLSKSKPAYNNALIWQTLQKIWCGLPLKIKYQMFLRANTDGSFPGDGANPVTYPRASQHITMH